jgi:hypothetical protein
MSKIFFIVYCSIFFSSTNFSKTYTGRYQSCSGRYTIDRKWTLKLTDENKFTYFIHTIDTKRPFGFNQINQDYFGSWVSQGDTLVLKIENLNKDCVGYSIKYLRKDSLLISLGGCIDSTWGFNLKFKTVMKLAK